MYWFLFFLMAFGFLHAAEEQPEKIIVSIKPMKECKKDIDKLCALWWNTTGKYKFNSFDDLKPQYENIFNKESSGDTFPMGFVAYHEREPIAYCSFKTSPIKEGLLPWADNNPDKFPWIALFVKEEYQQQGVGTQLVQSGCKHIYDKKELNCNTGYILAAEKDNDIIALYERKGAIQVARDTLNEENKRQVIILSIAFSEIFKSQ